MKFEEDVSEGKIQCSFCFQLEEHLVEFSGVFFVVFWVCKNALINLIVNILIPYTFGGGYMRSERSHLFGCSVVCFLVILYGIMAYTKIPISVKLS